MKIESTVVTLERGEPILPEHNVIGITIVRKLGGMYAVEKDADEILDEHLLG